MFDHREKLKKGELNYQIEKLKVKLIKEDKVSLEKLRDLIKQVAAAGGLKEVCL